MDFYLGEIRIFPFTRIPDGWVPCNGQVLNVNQYQALFSLLGNNYGGTSPQTFGLPNLNGSVVVGVGLAATGTTYQLGAAGAGGKESVTLTISQIPAHTHYINVGNSYDSSDPTNEFLGNPNIPTSQTQTRKNPVGSTTNIYTTSSPNTSLNPNSISTVGGSGAHENRQPYMPLVYCISTTGVYPPRP